MDLTIPQIPFKFKETVFWTSLWSTWVFSIYFHAPGLLIENHADNAWLFANAWLSSSTQSLGVQTFFSHGPLAQWLGMGLPGIPAFPLGGLLVQLFFFAGLVYAFFKFAIQIQSQGAIRRWVFYFLMSASLFWTDLQRPDESFYQFWMISHATLFYSETSTLARKVLLISWTIGGALLLGFYGSTGFACLVLLLIAWFFNGLVVGSPWHPIRYFLLYALTFEGCFKIASGHWNIKPYLRVLSELTFSYSETYALSPPSETYYLLGFLFVIAVFFLAWNYIRLQCDLPKRKNVFFLLSVFIWLFFEYKHGFIRADVLHIERFYKDTLPILIFWSFGTRLPNIRTIVLSAISLLFSLVCFVSTQQFPGRNTFMGLFKTRIQEAQDFSFNAIFSSHPSNQGMPYDLFLPYCCQDLLSFMHHEAVSFSGPQRPTFSLVSNQLILLRYLPDFDMQFMPTELQYISADCPDLQRANQVFLLNTSRPDYLLLDTPTIDGRCPLSDLSHLLAPILENYENIAFLDGFTVFKKKDTGRENARIFFPFLTTPLPSVSLRLTRSVVGFILKAPVLMVRVAFFDHKTKNFYVTNYRVTLSDLQNGVFMGPDSLLENFSKPPGLPQNFVTILKVQAYWAGWGSWFMKPWAHLPIEVKYFDPRDTPIKR
jgi:hypothetical protein